MNTNLDSRLIFFDFEVLKYDWLVVFNCNNQDRVIVNDCKSLIDFISSHSDYYFVGFNNYRYDDVICHKIIEGENPYKINNQIIDNSIRFNIDKYLYKSLDLYQDLKQVSLKKIMANLGLNIKECPIDFKIKRKLTDEELNIVIEYCRNDISATKYFYQYRKDYFQTKFKIIEKFGLNEDCIRLNENQLAIKILDCEWYEKYSDELTYDYCEDLNLDIIPNEILEFYGNIEYEFTKGVPYDELSKCQYEYDLLGCPTTYGFGGIHSAYRNITEHNNILQIDFSSFYPTIMINYNYFSRAITNRDKYKKIYNDRIELKKTDIETSNAFKLILNKPYGCMKNRGNILEDFKNCNEITINGQLIITQLVLELQKYCKLLQTNTDSITIKYNDYDKVKAIINDFCHRFKLSYSELKIKDLYQINVNNYIIVDENDNLKCKGPFFKNYEPKLNRDIYVSNSLSIIDKCRVESLVYNKSVEDVVKEAYDNNEIDRFQLVVSYGKKSFDGCYLEYGDDLIEQQKVCRVFATKDKNYGYIYKHKIEFDCIDDEYIRIPRSFEHNYVFNDNLDKFDKTILDLDYYIQLCKENILIEERDDA